MPQLVKASGESEEVKPNKRRFTIDELNKLIGSDIVEFVWPKRNTRVMLVVDEDGKAKKLPLNPVGSKHYGAPILGTIVVFTRQEYNELVRHPKDPTV